MNLRRFLQFILLPGLLLAASLWYLLRDINWQRFLAVWSEVSLTYALLALLLCAASVLALAVRLRFLAAGSLGATDSARAALIGLSLNVLLPAKLGELAKIAFISQRTGQTVSAATNIIFWERFFDLNILLVIAYVALSLGLPSLFSIGFLAFLVAMWTALAALKAFPGLATAVIRIIPFAVVRDFLDSLALHLARDLTGRTLVGGTSLTLLPWAVYVSQVLFVLGGVLSLELTLAQQLVVFIAASVAMAIPLTPGAIGVYEAAIVAVLVQFGIAKEVALGAAIMLHALQYLPLLFSGLWLTKISHQLLIQVQSGPTGRTNG